MLCIILTVFVLRKNCEFIDKTVQPFDWTYSTNYKGTLIGQDKMTVF